MKARAQKSILYQEKYQRRRTTKAAVVQSELANDNLKKLHWKTSGVIPLAEFNYLKESI